MKWDDTLAAFEKDVESRDFWDWMRAHTSWMKPLHRYEGTLELKGDKLIFFGEDAKEDGRIDLEIPLENIENVHLGFDETFRRREDRQIGLFGFAPLRIDYLTEGEEKKLYLFADFGRFPIRNAENGEVQKKLTELLDEF
ncbi:hypothetical protein AKJ66_00070 [candidate division MSBL1 archaeon SCGC-AAA259E22]|uniref:Uncharacterized protein n=1 Tax=candidate division MSBL1 archaeon SCGC-AAA259E22 TaxID=1698265 RepID=A0A133UIH4_9EURY|nr:hypothetical protein AKJ66_00070 [candidate division MSBL1 archaeon SCGC-AAA259E22]